MVVILDFRLPQKMKNFAKGHPMIQFTLHTQFWFNQIKSFIKPFINSYPLGGPMLILSNDFQSTYKTHFVMCHVRNIPIDYVVSEKKRCEISVKKKPTMLKL